MRWLPTLIPDFSPKCRVALLCGGIAAVMAGSPAGAADLGVFGPTYEITEPHLLRFIEQRLREKERSGELKRLLEQARTRGVLAVTQPTPVVDLRRTTTARSFHVDPSITLDRNISDGAGRLLFAAGTRANPLDVVSMSRSLLFFDARDGRQVNHARQLMAAHAGKLKPILTGGSYLELMKAWRMPVYYDQQGVLVKRFGIRQVPALVSQEGKRLRIDEVAIP